MKIKKAIKKIVALGAGATMVGATLLGAMATDLSNYPAPFVQDGSINNAMRTTIKKQYTTLSREYQRMKNKSENPREDDDEYALWIQN